MESSWIISIFFLISFISLFLSVFMFKKTNEKINGIVWIVVSYILTIAFNALIAGVVNLIHIHINILTVGIADLIFAGILWAFIILKKMFQHYTWKLQDIAIIAIIFVVVMVFAWYHYGLKTLIPNFQAVDAPIHLKCAQNIINNQSINSSMYYADLYGALFIETLSPLLPNYKIFVISEIVNLFVAGMVFYAFISEMCKSKISYILAMLVSILYLLGYPLHNTLFGFVYWGMGVSLINTLLVMYREFSKKRINRMVVCVYLMVLNFGLFTTYVLFIPPVFLASFLYIVFIKYKEGKLFTIKTLIELAVVFLPAIILGLLYTFSLIQHIDVSKTIEKNKSGSGSIAGISKEGVIYKDLYRDFIFLLPFSLYEFVNQFKKSKVKMNFILFIIMFLYMFLLFLGGMKGLVSSYYYCKNNYIMWLILFVAAFAGMVDILEKNKDILYTYLVTWGMIGVILLTRVEVKIAECNSNYDITNASDYLSIYNYNAAWCVTPCFNYEYMNLIEWMDNNVEKKGKKGAIAVNTFYYEHWYQALVNREDAIYNGDYNNYINLCESNADYICVIYDDFYVENKNHFDNMEKVYETQCGFVAKINK